MAERTNTGMEPASSVYDQTLYELSYADTDWNAARRLLARCIRKGKPGRILDIGCGLGFFVECCCRFGVPCTGLERCVGRGRPDAMGTIAHYSISTANRKLGQRSRYSRGLIAIPYPVRIRDPRDPRPVNPRSASRRQSEGPRIRTSSAR